LLYWIGIIPAIDSFGFVWQFFLKDRKQRSDANTRAGIFRQ